MRYALTWGSDGLSFLCLIYDVFTCCLPRGGAAVGCFRFAFRADPYARAIGSMLATILNRIKFRDFIRYRNKLATCVRRSMYSRGTVGAMVTRFPLSSARVACAFARTRSGS